MAHGFKASSQLSAVLAVTGIKYEIKLRADQIMTKQGSNATENHAQRVKLLYSLELSHGLLLLNTTPTSQSKSMKCIPKHWWHEEQTSQVCIHCNAIQSHSPDKEIDC